MKLSPLDRLRRGLGIVFLATGGLMTLAGLTWLDTRLTGVVFLGYWTLAGGSALAAFACALIDMRIMRERIEAEQQALFRKYFEIPGRSANARPAGRTPVKNSTSIQPQQPADQAGQKI